MFPTPIQKASTGRQISYNIMVPIALFFVVATDHCNFPYFHPS